MFISSIFFPWHSSLSDCLEHHSENSFLRKALQCLLMSDLMVEICGPCYLELAWVGCFVVVAKKWHHMLSDSEKHPRWGEWLDVVLPRAGAVF